MVKPSLLAEVGGTWGSPQIVATSASFTSVSCSAAGQCVAGGNRVGCFEAEVVCITDQAFVISEVGGTWESPVGFSATDTQSYVAPITSVSCPSTGNCSAGGYFGGAGIAGSAFVVNETAGTWGSIDVLAGSLHLPTDSDADEVTSVSCSSAGNCSAGGFYGVISETEHPFVVSESAGTWSLAQPVSMPSNMEGKVSFGGIAEINVLSCPADGDCSAVGWYPDGDATFHAFAVDETGGTWAAAQEVAGSLSSGTANLNSVSCPSAGNCTAAGYYENQAEGFSGLAVTETAGAWDSGRSILSPGIADASAEIDTISCTSTYNCVAGGFADDVNDFGQAMLVTEAPSIPLPTVTGISPSTGPAIGGTSVTITGTNLSGATTVDFGGNAATGIVVHSATSITATSPVGSGTVDVTVSTPGGTSATSSADQFTYAARPPPHLLGSPHPSASGIGTSRGPPRTTAAARSPPTR